MNKHEAEADVLQKFHEEILLECREEMDTEILTLVVHDGCRDYGTVFYRDQEFTSVYVIVTEIKIGAFFYEKLEGRPPTTTRLTSEYNVRCSTSYNWAICEASFQVLNKKQQKGRTKPRIYNCPLCNLPVTVSMSLGNGHRSINCEGGHGFIE